MTSTIRHILLDIEGTTCPVSFVSEVLFPYAAREVSSYLARHSRDSDIEELLTELQTSWKKEDDPEAVALLRESGITGEAEPLQPVAKASPDPTDRATRLLPYIHWLIRRDIKLTAWKDLQGRIWHEGYERGALRATLFPEVAATLRRWKQLGFNLSVYSSGSVAAQQLLYGHSEDGDLRPLFSHWFDTRIGLKQEADSYRSILEILGCQPEQVLFISDSSAELLAAHACGFQVRFSDRPGNPDRNPRGFVSLQSLEELTLSPSAA